MEKKHSKTLDLLYKIAVSLGDASKILLGSGAACLIGGYIASLIYDIKLNKLNNKK